MTVFEVNTANEAGLLLNNLVAVAQDSKETPDELSRVRTYFDEYYAIFGTQFINTLKDRIRAGTLSADSMRRIDSAFDWTVSGKPGTLVPQVDTPSEAGLLLNAMAWISATDGFTKGEHDRLAECFKVYEGAFGARFRADLRQRIDRGELSRYTMKKIAPQHSW